MDAHHENSITPQTQFAGGYQKSTDVSLCSSFAFGKVIRKSFKRKKDTHKVRIQLRDRGKKETIRARQRKNRYYSAVRGQLLNYNQRASICSYCINSLSTRDENG